MRIIWDSLAKASAFPSLTFLRSQLIHYSRYTEDLYQRELELYKKHGKCAQARQLYSQRLRQFDAWPHTLPEMLCLITMHISGHHKDPIQASNIFHSFIQAGQREILGTEGFNAILQVWASSVQSSRCDEHLRHYFSQMSNSIDGLPNNCTPNAKTFEWMVVGLMEIREVEEFYAKALQAGFASPSLHEKFLRRLTNAGEGEKALEIYEELKQTPGMVDSAVLTQLLRYCTTVGDLAGTNRIFEDAKELGIHPTANMYSLLIDLCATVKSSEMAQNILIEDLPRYGIEPHHGIYSSMLRLHCATGDISKAEATFKEMQLRGFSVTALNFQQLITSLLTKAAEEHQPDLENIALDYWREMQRLRVKPTISLLAALLGMVQDANFVDFTLNAAAHLTYSRNSLTTLAQEVAALRLASLDRILLVLHRLSEYQSFKMTPTLYHTVINRLSEGQRWKDAIDMAIEFAEVSSAIMDSVSPPLTKYVAAIDAKSGFSLSYEMAQDFLQHVVHPNDLSKPTYNWYPEETEGPWDRNQVDHWRLELYRWRSEAANKHLL
jgi:pentatricopeptide repeat protein